MTAAQEASEAPTRPQVPQSLEFADVWVLVWSHSQNATHVEPLSRMLASNRRAYADNTPMDYVPLYIGDQESAHTMSRSLRQTLRERESERSPSILSILGLGAAH